MKKRCVWAVRGENRWLWQTVVTWTSEWTNSHAQWLDLEKFVVNPNNATVGYGEPVKLVVDGLQTRNRSKIESKSENGTKILGIKLGWWCRNDNVAVTPNYPSAELLSPRRTLRYGVNALEFFNIDYSMFCRRPPTVPTRDGTTKIIGCERRV